MNKITRLLYNLTDIGFVYIYRTENYFFHFLIMFVHVYLHMSHDMMVTYFNFINLIFTTQIMFYFMQSILVLPVYIDRNLTLYISIFPMGAGLHKYRTRVCASRYPSTQR